MNRPFTTILFNIACIIWLFPSNAVKAQISIDHLIIAVNNLDSVIDYYHQLGFTVKRGRKHANGLNNAHIKFINASSLELMTVEGEPGDSMAQQYKDFINSGQNGVYIALSGVSFDSLAILLRNHNIEFSLTKSKLWNYLTFPESSGLESLFFIEYHTKPSEPLAKFQHRNKANGFGQITMDGNPHLYQLFHLLELTRVTEKIFHTSTGDIILHPTSFKRSYIRHITFEDSEGNSFLSLKL